MPHTTNRPGQTQWITYSQRPKSCNGIKGDFVTWTRLGLEGRVENKKVVGSSIKGGATMPPERIAELRRLLELDNSVTLSAKEFTWLLDIHDQMKAALGGLFETHVAIDPPE
jgi:hypothetical protein